MRINSLHLRHSIECYWVLHHSLTDLQKPEYRWKDQMLVRAEKSFSRLMIGNDDEIRGKIPVL